MKTYSNIQTTERIQLVYCAYLLCTHIVSHDCAEHISMGHRTVQHYKALLSYFYELQSYSQTTTISHMIQI